ncbi:MAG: FliM/FliN family flagellar motor switch protein [Bauldia sp.]
MDTISSVSVEIAVVIGTSLIPIHQLLKMGRGAVIELDATEDSLVDILANNIPIAKGQVVMRGDRISINVTEVLPRSPTYRPREPVSLLE